MTDQMSTREACAVIDGLDEKEYASSKGLAAWQSLVNSGMAWQIQDWYASVAERMIAAGLLHTRGEHVDESG